MGCTLSWALWYRNEQTSQKSGLCKAKKKNKYPGLYKVYILVQGKRRKTDLKK